MKCCIISHVQLHILCVLFKQCAMTVQNRHPDESMCNIFWPHGGPMDMEKDWFLVRSIENQFDNWEWQLMATFHNFCHWLRHLHWTETHTLWHQKVIFFVHWLFQRDGQWIGLKHVKWTGVVSPCELCSFLENLISGVTLSNFSHDKTKRFSFISLVFWCRRKGIQCMIFTTM